MTTDDFAFAPPPFKPEEALVRLRRELREVRGLAERGAGFECRGHVVVELSLDGQAIQARLVERPARTPRWEAHRLTTAAEVRRFTEEVRRRLARWADDE